MGWQDTLGGLVNQVTSKQQASETTSTEAAAGTETGTESGLLGSVLGAAVTSLGGAPLAERLNQATSFLAPEQKRELVGGLLGRLGVSGAGAQALLQQLGINPAVADDPHDATPEELARLAQHAADNSETTADDGAVPAAGATAIDDPEPGDNDGDVHNEADTSADTWEDQVK
ncbi:MAG: hypothetical protein HY011_23575 [Acidobacteria bacterium]|nr:hypothetical protein [Acidobacteriota bacterium]